ncbi:MAG: hypothetical protein QCI00_00070 [Candidatus Thermoplasmatota archaeon]|nr:hypothetical protein [Candidatus Thermoplasmatota archaeon]
MQQTDKLYSDASYHRLRRKGFSVFEAKYLSDKPDEMRELYVRLRKDTIR